MKKVLTKKHIYAGLVSCLMLFISVGIVFAESVVLSWNPPTTNQDETALSDLAGYKVYIGTVSGNYSQSYDAGNVETYQVNNLSTGVTYYFATTAYDTSYNESGYSSEVSKTFSPVTVTYYCDSDIDGYFNISADGSCTGTGCEPAGCQVAQGNDCNDANTDINPGAADYTCDGVDNNCDGTADNDYVVTVSSCGTGVCSSVGRVLCQEGTEVNTCTSGTPQEISETTCNDGLDNDCDGQADEGCFPGIKVSNVLLSEDFSSGMPADWSVQGTWSTDNKCGRTIGYPFEGAYAISDSSCTATDVNELVTASIDTVSCTNVELTFSNQYDWYSGNIEVDVSSDGGATWAGNLMVDADDGYPTPGWKDADISTVAGVSDAQVKFKYSNSSSGGFWALDNVWVTCQASQLQFSSPVQVPLQKTIMVSNNGQSALTVSAVNIGGVNASEFSIGANDDCTNQTLQPDETCTVDIIFTPAASGARSASISILSNDPDTPIFNIDAEGLGTAAGIPVPLIKVNGSKGIVDVGRAEKFSAAIELEPGLYNGKDADWWLLMEYRGRWHYYDGATGKWIKGYSFYKQGQLSKVDPITVLDNSTRLLRGTYKVYFGIDTKMNGSQDVESYYYDSVTINIK